MKIVVEELKHLQGYEEQCDLFIALGLDGVEITEELCVKHAQDFDWHQAANRLLGREARTTYHLAREALDLAIVPAQEVYNLAWETRFLARGPAIVPAQEAYNLAWEAYHPVQEAQQLAYARAFFDATQLEDRTCSVV